MLGNVIKNITAGGASDLVSAIGDAIDKNVTSDEERLEAENLKKKMDLNKEEIVAGIERLLIEADTKIVDANTRVMQSVNQTMQAESKADSWWQSGWRPFWGFCSAIAFTAISIFVTILAYKAVIYGNKEAMDMIPRFVTSITTLFSIPGLIVGVTAYKRGQEKIERLKK